MPNLYQELADYIYQYCSEFQTPTEKMAIKTLLYSLNTETEERRKMMLERGIISDAPAVLAMIADGREAFKQRLVNRIWQNHQYELKLNLCPKCYKIARTPLARQCRFCFHNWH